MVTRGSRLGVAYTAARGIAIWIGFTFKELDNLQNRVLSIRRCSYTGSNYMLVIGDDF